MSHEAAMKSRFAALWSAEPGIDPYAFAVSDPYQDGMGQGILLEKAFSMLIRFIKFYVIGFRKSATKS
ncbi:hypothetical protein KHA80_00590 [Anaerobacillus sp. HL2]|nr:hypothetical protein KHA80_00590 [Anaerobacillus sp. HL2]